jgi:hypothetical protein
MKPLVTFLTSLALCAAASAEAPVHPAPVDPHALRYGKRCILKRGALIAVSELCLRRWLYLPDPVARKRVVDQMLRNHQIESTIVDAVATAVAPHGWAADIVEVHVAGELAHVYTPRVCVDGDVRGYLATH